MRGYILTTNNGEIVNLIVKVGLEYQFHTERDGYCGDAPIENLLSMLLGEIETIETSSYDGAQIWSHLNYRRVSSLCWLMAANHRARCDYHTGMLNFLTKNESWKGITNTRC